MENENQHYLEYKERAIDEYVHRRLLSFIPDHVLRLAASTKSPDEVGYVDHHGNEPSDDQQVEVFVDQYNI